jgi:hypothetical protein
MLMLCRDILKPQPSSRTSRSRGVRAVLRTTTTLFTAEDFARRQPSTSSSFEASSPQPVWTMPAGSSDTGSGSPRPQAPSIEEATHGFHNPFGFDASQFDPSFTFDEAMPLPQPWTFDFSGVSPDLPAVGSCLMSRSFVLYLIHFYLTCSHKFDTLSTCNDWHMHNLCLMLDLLPAVPKYLVMMADVHKTKHGMPYFMGASGARGGQALLCDTWVWVSNLRAVRQIWVRTRVLSLSDLHHLHGQSQMGQTRQICPIVFADDTDLPTSLKHLCAFRY